MNTDQVRDDLAEAVRAIFNDHEDGPMVAVARHEHGRPHAHVVLTNGRLGPARAERSNTDGP